MRNVSLEDALLIEHKMIFMIIWIHLSYKNWSLYFISRKWELHVLQTRWSLYDHGNILEAFLHAETQKQYEGSRFEE